MKTFTFTLLLLIASNTATAQEAVAAAGHTGNMTGYVVDWTMGEPVIETLAHASHILTQGMHQTRLIVTANDNKEIPGLEITVFPNPVHQLLNIKIQRAGTLKLSYRLENLLGGSILQKVMISETEEIDMKILPPGIYILSVWPSMNKWKKTFQIIKNQER